MGKRFDDSINEIWELLCSRDFWMLTGIGLTLFGILVAGMIMLTNFDMARMSCGKMEDMPAFLLINIFIIFVFGGLVAMGEGFTYFDEKKLGFRPRKSYLLTFLGAALLLGIVGLVMLKVYC
ncbi:MAG: hypothetical protein WC091_22365 [Sulfuricellaceae bacterium]